MAVSNRVILTCSICLSRNYTTYKNKQSLTKRLVLNKYCKHCNKATEHKETK